LIPLKATCRKSTDDDPKLVNEAKMGSKEIIKYKRFFMPAFVIGIVAGLVHYSLQGDLLTLIFFPIGILMMTLQFIFLKEHRKNHNNSHLKF